MKAKPAPPREFVINSIKCKVQLVDISNRTGAFKYRIWINGIEKCPVWIDRWKKNGISQVNLINYDWESFFIKEYPTIFS